jgi:hypothetical protein
MKRLTDAELLTSIREATAAWQAPQDTEYYAAKHGYMPGAMIVRLRQLAAAGLITRHAGRAWGKWVDTWEAKETP